MNKQNFRKFAVFLLIPLHLLLAYLFTTGNHSGTFYLLSVLLVLLADFVLSFWLTEVMTSRRNSLRVFASDFLPHFWLKLVMIAAEGVLMHVICKGKYGLLDIGFGYLLAYAAAVASMLLSALVTFVTGAARTMLYHDEKGETK